MMTVTRRFTGAAVLAISLFLWSCDNLAEPTRPELRPSGLTVTSTSGEVLMVAYEASPSAATVSGTIDTAGGTLTLGGHQLTVPANAVSAPTVFTMTRDLEYPLRVKLTATRDSLNDVGSAGFPVPVSLGISYDSAAELPSDITEMEVIYFRPDGLVDEVPTTIDGSGNRVVATVSHFSMYGIGWP